MNTSSAFLLALRPRQWIKNLVVFAPLVFAVDFLDGVAFARSGAAFILVCLTASGLYLTNDLRDREEDRRHPTKRDRPVASGRISPLAATVSALLLLFVGLVGAYILGPLTAMATLGFVAINLWYSFGGKNIAILDVMLIGASFVARVLVGAAAIAVPPSSWLLLTLFFLATYLGFTKRGAEMRLAVDGTRTALIGYTSPFLLHARLSTLAVTLALYTLYSFSSPFGSLMALTVPFVFFGLMRYEAIAETDRGENDGPADHIYRDRSLQMAVFLWGIAVGLVILFAPA